MCVCVCVCAHMRVCSRSDNIIIDAAYLGHHSVLERRSAKPAATFSYPSLVSIHVSLGSL